MKQIMLMRRRLGFDDVTCQGIAGKAHRRIFSNSMSGLEGIGLKALRDSYGIFHI